MRPSYIIIHQSKSKDSERVLNWPQLRAYHMDVRGWRDIGYHYGIELVAGEPEILVGRFMNVQGAHCPENGMNNKSLGVVIVGNFDFEPPSPQIWNTAVTFVASLCESLRISHELVLGHGEVMKTRAVGTAYSCPGEFFDMNKFRLGIQGRLVNGISQTREDYLQDKERRED